MVIFLIVDVVIVLAILQKPRVTHPFLLNIIVVVTVLVASVATFLEFRVTQPLLLCLKTVVVVIVFVVIEVVLVRVVVAGGGSFVGFKSSGGGAGNGGCVGFVLHGGGGGRSSVRFEGSGGGASDGGGVRLVFDVSSRGCGGELIIIFLAVQPVAVLSLWDESRLLLFVECCRLLGLGDKARRLLLLLAQALLLFVVGCHLNIVVAAGAWNFAEELAFSGMNLHREECQ